MTPREQLRAALSEIEKGADNARNILHVSEAVRLVNAIRFFVKEAPVSEIHRLFGAPGDWGYDTPLGAALHRLYSEKEAPRG